MDGPGPGSYKMPKQYQDGRRPLDIVKRTTFGTAARGVVDKRDVPSPSKYRPSKFTEASHGFSFPKAPGVGEVKHKRDYRDAPGPATYDIAATDLANQKKQAKSMLAKTSLPGDKLDEKNPVPGPQTYNQILKENIPGFKIVADAAHVKKENVPQVGPGTYDPVNPSLAQTNVLAHANAKDMRRRGEATSIGRAVRADMVQKMKVPGPGRYEYDDCFKRPAKFHLGAHTGSFMGKNLDMPGPGEYETDVIPNHHSNISHFIGTSVRSDLGVGKAYMYPGPQEYEVQVDPAMDPRIRIAGTFGTQKKDTVIKKTFAPGPGSYDAATSVGQMPQYLRTEENKRMKKAQEDALRARLEI